MKKFFTLFVFCYLLFQGGYSQQLQLLKDINPSGDCNFFSATLSGYSLYFQAKDNLHGFELWRTDGSTQNTYLVKDVNPSGNGIYETGLSDKNNIFYFSGRDTITNSELWRTDGTDTGTYLVKDIRPGKTVQSAPTNFFKFKGGIYFIASTTTGKGLYKTDGTSTGTILVSNFTTFQALVCTENIIYILANSNMVYRSDGTSSGFVLIKTITTNLTAASFKKPVILNDTLYFAGFNDASINGLWKCDGTAEGTVLIKSLTFNVNYPAPIVYKNKIYFAADDGVSGTELWCSDGTTNGTYLVKDINPGTNMSSPSNICIFKGSLFFSAINNSSYDLWTSDGTTTGTKMVKKINVSGNSSVGSLTPMKNHLYFKATNGVNGVELWKSDGTSTGTSMEADIWAGASSSDPYGLIAMGNKLIFRANDNVHGLEPWVLTDTLEPHISFTPIDSVYCASDNPVMLLNANPPGGTFSGNGISGNKFYPSKTTTTTTVITYQYDTASVSQTVFVKNADVHFTGLDSIYTCGIIVNDTLIGYPAGGTFSGTGVTNNIFSTTALKPGTYVISYTYTDSTGCTIVRTKNVVISGINVTYSGLSAAYCSAANSVTLAPSPVGGTFSGSGIVGNIFTPSLADIGQQDITYTFIDSNTCVYEVVKSTLVKATPQPDFIGLDPVHCSSDLRDTLVGTPLGGSFSGSGISGNYFTPTSLSQNLYTIRYTYTNNGCTGIKEKTTFVSKPTANFTGLDAEYCFNGSIDSLTGIPSGGVFSGTGVNSNMYNPSLVPIGNASVTYVYTDTNKCSATKTLNTKITDCWKANCTKAEMVKDIGAFTTSYARADKKGNIHIVGYITSAPLTLGSVTINNDYAYTYFYASFDSLGNVKKVFPIGGGEYATCFFNLNHNNDIIFSFSVTSFSVKNIAYPQQYNSQNLLFTFDKNGNLKNNAVNVNGRQISDIQFDTYGNIYLTGYTDYSSLNFYQQAPIRNRFYNYYGNQITQYNSFLIKLDSNQHVIYSKFIGNDADNLVRNLSIDNQGAVYISGNANKSTKPFQTDLYDAIPGTKDDNAFFVIKYNSETGQYLWGKLFGGLDIQGNSVIDESCNLYLQTEKSEIIKLDSSGNQKWKTSTMNLTSTQLFYNNGTIIQSGSCGSGSIINGFALSTLNTTPSDFIATYKTDGTLNWVANSPSAGLSLDLFYSGAFTYTNSSFYAIGSFKNTQTWYPLSLTNGSGANHGFIVKYVDYSKFLNLKVNAGIDKSTTCNTSTTLTGTTIPTTGVQYRWTNTNDLAVGTTLSYSVKPAKTSDYILWGGLNGCITSDTAKVSLTNNTLTVNTGADKTICEGDSIQLNAFTNNSSATLQWSPTTAVTSTKALTTYVSPIATTDYVLKATLNSCIAYDTVKVSVNPKPFIQLPWDDQSWGFKVLRTCRANETIIQAGNLTNTYTWSSSDGPSSFEIINPGIIKTIPLQDSIAEYRVTVTHNQGCVASDYVRVVFYKPMRNTIITLQPINKHACLGDSVRFDSHQEYESDFSYSSWWEVDTGDGFKTISSTDNNYKYQSGSNGNPFFFAYCNLYVLKISSASYNYRFRMRGLKKCSLDTTTSDTVRIIKGPKIDLQPISTLFCEGIKNSINVLSKTSNASYYWEYLKDGQFTSVTSSSEFDAQGTKLNFPLMNDSLHNTKIRCRITGCTPLSTSISDSIALNVLSRPDITQQPATKTICEDGDFPVQVKLSPGIWTYLWFLKNKSLIVETSSLAYIAGSLFKDSTYYAKCMISHKTCPFNIFSDSVKPSFHQPIAPIVIRDSIFCPASVPFLIPATPSGGYIFIDHNSKADGKFSFTYPKNYLITYRLFNTETQCFNTKYANYTLLSSSDAQCLSTTINSEVYKPFNVYPNPTNKFIQIDLGSRSTNSNLIIYDNIGQIVYSSDIHLNTNTIEIDVSNFAAGLYWVKFENELLTFVKQ